VNEADRPRAFASEPPRERPDSPPESYGVPTRGGEFVAWDGVVHRLATASAYWLATVSPDGRPHVVPTWGAMVDADLFLDTGAPETVKSRNLQSNDRVVVHLDNVDDVVVIHGRAVPVRPDEALGRELAAAYRAKYAGYEPEADSWSNGGLVRLEPERLLAWREMPTATRWRFARDER
jgi:hypothetical protein